MAASQPVLAQHLIYTSFHPFGKYIACFFACRTLLQRYFPSTAEVQQLASPSSSHQTCSTHHMQGSEPLSDSSNAFEELYLAAANAAGTQLPSGFSSSSSRKSAQQQLMTVLRGCCLAATAAASAVKQQTTQQHHSMMCSFQAAATETTQQP